MRSSCYIFLVIIGLASCIADDTTKISINTVPETLNDGWEVSTPSEEDVNADQLESTVESFFSEEVLEYSKALLIAKNGKIILETYFKDLDDRNRKHNVKSVTKSISSTLVGIAILHGAVDTDLDRTVYSYIPEAFDDNERKQEITLRHCLRMTTGLEDPFYTVAPVLPGNSIKTSLDVALVHRPGEVHGYNNGSANIFGGVVSAASKKSYEEFAIENLFTPLGITDHHWVKHSDGVVNPAFDLYLRPRDVLRWGQFCLQNGNWNDEQLLPDTWLDESTTYYEDGFDGKFGYHWWIHDDYNCYYANGHGGQRVWILPDHDLVVVHLAEPSTDQTDLSEIPVVLDRIMESM